jgi:hypothetical protein
MRVVVREPLDALILKNQVAGVIARVGVNGTEVRNARESELIEKKTHKFLNLWVFLDYAFIY